MRADSTDRRHDYALHDIITGNASSREAQNKRWWAKRIMGPDGQRYARMLFGLPQGDAQ